VLLEKAASNLQVTKDDILGQRLTTEQLAALPRALPPQGAPIFGPPFVARTGVTQTEVTGTVPTNQRNGYSSP
jgi:hypothetical protein